MVGNKGGAMLPFLMVGAMGEWLLERAKEPSTWKGVGWLLVACGVAPVGAVDVLVSVGVAVVGLVEVARKEGGK